MRGRSNEKDELLDTSSESTRPQYDYVIVGGGVAGILSAEMLSRSGKKVLLIEKEKKLASESSGEQHGWGQFGYLYLNALDPGVAEACLKNIDILLNSYPMPGNNLIADESGQLVSKDPHADESWYRADPVYYYYPEPDENTLKLTREEQQDWEKKLHHVLQRTQAISEKQWKKDVNVQVIRLPHYSEAEGKKLLVAKKAARKWMKKTAELNPEGKIAAKLKAEKKDTTVRTDIIIESHDRPMRSTRILTSVHTRFKRNGGETALATQVTDYQVKEGMVELTTSTGDRITAEKVIFTAAGGLHDIKGSNVKTVLSPLLIISPPIFDRNIVYLTPKTEFTINHLHHVDPITGVAYSIIGNGDGISPDDENGIKMSRENIIAQAEKVFPNLKNIPEEDKHVYFGYKTEFMKPGKDRNYHYAFISIDEDGKVWAAVPGKFTLAPSLATHIYERLEGEKPPVQTFTQEEESEYKELLASHSIAIAETLHSQIVGKRVGSDQYSYEGRVGRSKLSESANIFTKPSKLKEQQEKKASIESQRGNKV